MDLKSVHVCFEVESYPKAMEFYGPLFPQYLLNKTISFRRSARKMQEAGCAETLAIRQEDQQ